MGSSMKRILIAFTILLGACELRLRKDTYTYCDSTGCYECDSWGCWSTGARPPGQSCTGNWSCSAGCYCGPGNTCVETGMCSKNSDCPSGHICDSRSTCIPGGPGNQCTADANCPTGQFCDKTTNMCVPSQTCSPSYPCPTGMTCDPARGTCVPVSCRAPTDCPRPTYCNLQTGLCVPTMTCQTNQDCQVLPGNLTCDPTRHVCVPSLPPPACTTNANCPTGQTCCNGVCKTPPPPPAGTCTYSGECGGGVCRLDFRGVGLCHAPCTTDANCGTGDSCQNGFCDTNPNSPRTCVFNTSCPANHTCINGVCHANCTTDANCTNPADFCDQGICQPDWRVVTECAVDHDCTHPGEQCVNGQCRTRCMTDAQCVNCVDGPTCVNGYCAAPVK